MSKPCSKSRIASVQKNKKACFYCGTSLRRIMITVDHIIPKYLNGADTRYNKVLCCHDCNQLKANLTLEQFINVVVSNPHFKDIDFTLTRISMAITYIDNIKEKVSKKQLTNKALYKTSQNARRN